MAEQIEISKERYDEIVNKEVRESNLDVYEEVYDSQDADDIISDLAVEESFDIEAADPDSIAYDYDPNNPIYNTESNEMYIDRIQRSGNANNQAGFDANKYKMNGSTLTDDDYKRAALSLGTEIAVVKAVTFVESNGRGFDSQKRPKILFEAHQFGKLTNYQYNDQSDISCYSWAEGKPYYRGDQYQRLDKASRLDKTAAQKSASWGLFQIMGFNHKMCGYNNVDDYVKAMFESEGKHLDAFVNFVKNNNTMKKALVNKDWATFARNYNGPLYKDNDYDTKLAEAYRAYKA